MAYLHIVTDSSVYFPDPEYLGRELVSVVPLSVRVGGKTLTDNLDDHRYKRLLASLDPQKTTLIPPSVEEFCRLFWELGQKHVDILAILHSGSLSATYENACKAASIVKNSGAIVVLDSQTFGAGLGLLVQAASQAALNQLSLHKVSQIARGIIPHLYTALFIPNLTFLAKAGFLDPDQAMVGEMLGILPFYILDAGRLVAVQKARNPRQLVDMIYEFISEFSRLTHIALMQGYPPYEQEMRNLKERIANSYASTPLSEYRLAPSMMTLLGSRIFGVIAFEEPEDLPLK